MNASRVSVRIRRPIAAGIRTVGIAAAVAAAAMCVSAVSPVVAAPPPPPLEPEDGGVLDLPMFVDPELPRQPRQEAFPPGVEEVWLDALDQDEVELRHQALLAFAEAHERGLPELEAIPPRALEILEHDPSPSVRHAAAETLIRFDYEDAASALLAASDRERGYEMAVAVDPALVRWGHEPARAVWRSRVADDDALLAVRRSAARSLGELNGDEYGTRDAAELAGESAEDLATLRRVVASSAAPVSLRLDAAAALRRMTRAGLVDLAGTLAAGEPLDRMLAATALGGHDEPEAIERLVELVRDADAAVAAVAMRGLRARAPQVAYEMRDELIASGEPNVRYRLVQALAQVPEPGAVATLGELLDDTSRAVRFHAREVLIDHGRDEALREAAFEAIARGLDAHGPYGQEQAALAAGKLDHIDVAPRLAELLQSETWRVRRGAANALHELRQPETLPAIHQRLAEITERVQAAELGSTRPEVRHEMMLLIMGLGVMAYDEADSLLREYVPKGSPFPVPMRSAAIWALGKIHTDAVDDGLAGSLHARLTDTQSQDPEATMVRAYSAVALGMMDAEDYLDTLRYKADSGPVMVRSAARWAVHRMTGEPQPDLSPSRQQIDWFIEPLAD